MQQERFQLMHSKSFWTGLELLGHPISGIRLDKWIPNHLWDWIVDTRRPLQIPNLRRGLRPWW